ncbi:MAG: FMN-binding protein [Actinomycetota bacterium]|nr:FMN-binding protein [Actinomycetota bacterium]
MRRILLAITGTVVGLVALLSFKTHPALTQASLPSAQLPGTGRTSTPSSGASGQVPTTTTTPTTATPTTATPKPSQSAAAATDYSGQSVQTRYGIVQVKVTLSGHQITNVSFLQLTDYDSRSQQINQQAAPILLQQTLSAQSAQIDGVSGATYTSTGYEQSLQSALDQAGS